MSFVGSFEASHIEDAHDVPIEESILKSEVLISWCSTVLFQGYVNEKKNRCGQRIEPRPH